MGISLVLAVTDNDWFDQLRHRPDLEEVNFWSPSPRQFRSLRGASYSSLSCERRATQSQAVGSLRTPTRCHAPLRGKLSARPTAPVRFPKCEGGLPSIGAPSRTTEAIFQSGAGSSPNRRSSTNEIGFQSQRIGPRGSSTTRPTTQRITRAGSCGKPLPLG